MEITGGVLILSVEQVKRDPRSERNAAISSNTAFL